MVEQGPGGDSSKIFEIIKKFSPYHTGKPGLLSEGQNSQNADSQEEGTTGFKSQNLLRTFAKEDNDPPHRH